LDDTTQSHEHTRTPTHDTRRKRFARKPESESVPDKRKNNAEQTNVRERIPPPIYLTTKVKNYMQFTKSLKESVGDNFQLKYLGEQIKIQFNKIKDFLDFKKFAFQMNYTFHTYFATKRENDNSYTKRISQYIKSVNSRRTS